MHIWFTLISGSFFAIFAAAQSISSGFSLWIAIFSLIAAGLNCGLIMLYVLSINTPLSAACALIIFASLLPTFAVLAFKYSS